MGYNIVYGLINFAILAAGLYFVGRKLIPKIFGGNRKKIEDALNEADQAVEDAKSIHKEIEAASTRGAEECAEIIHNAEMTAEAEKQRALEADRRAVDSVKTDTEKEIQYRTRTVRRALTREALDEVTARAASRIVPDRFSEREPRSILISGRLL